jgi:hypothetical protein
MVVELPVVESGALFIESPIDSIRVTIEFFLGMYWDFLTLPLQASHPVEYLLYMGIVMSGHVVAIPFIVVT